MLLDTWSSGCRTIGFRFNLSKFVHHKLHNQLIKSVNYGLLEHHRWRSKEEEEYFSVCSLKQPKVSITEGDGQHGNPFPVFLQSGLNIDLVGEASAAPLSFPQTRPQLPLRIPAEKKKSWSNKYVGSCNKEDGLQSKLQRGLWCYSKLATQLHRLFSRLSWLLPNQNQRFSTWS